MQEVTHQPATLSKETISVQWDCNEKGLEHSKHSPEGHSFHHARAVGGKTDSRLTWVTNRASICDETNIRLLKTSVLGKDILDITNMIYN